MRAEAIPARTGHNAPPPPPGEQLQAMSTLVTGKRYLLLSVLATAIAVASTYQRLHALSPVDWHELLLEHASNATAAVDALGTAVGDATATITSSSSSNTIEVAAATAADDVTHLGGGSLTLTLFLAELMRSRVSAAIVMHFYSVLLYHIFLVVAHACFGAIRPAEIQQTKETLIHFILMRCLLLASTIGSGPKTRLALLLVWLSAVAFLRGILSLASARFEHLLTRPMAQLRELHRVALTLVLLVVVDASLAIACSWSSSFTRLIVHFAWFEASLLLLKTLQLGTQVAFHVLDVGNSAALGTESAELYLLLLQTALSAAYVVQLVCYYLYIISVDQFRVSFLDFILILNVKNATVGFLEHLRKVQLYRRVVLDLDAQFRDATPSEVAAVADDVCVICLKPMLCHAKRLHCGHLFHRLCLRQCLQRASIGDAFTAAVDAPVRLPPTGLGGFRGGENDRAQQQEAIGGRRGGGARRPRVGTTLRCPICRKHVHADRKVEEEEEEEEGRTTGRRQLRLAAPAAGLVVADVQANDEQRIETDVNDNAAIDAQDELAANDDMEDVIRFSTEFLSRWIPFPNVSFEIVRHRTAAATAAAVVTPEMVQHVAEVFPQHSLESIQADLIVTRSPERTIERILNGQFTGADAAAGHENADAASAARAFSTLWATLWHPTPAAIIPQERDTNDAVDER